MELEPQEDFLQDDYLQRRDAVIATWLFVMLKRSLDEAGIPVESLETLDLIIDKAFRQAATEWKLLTQEEDPVLSGVVVRGRR